jgi:polyhydroxyalkanoate synthesis regulator protein
LEAEEKTLVPDGSILDPTVHARLLDDIESVSRQANVPVHMIHRSMKDFCTSAEIKWFRHYKLHMINGDAGICFVGTQPKVNQKIMAIAGAFLRNFIDARVITLTALLQATKEGDSPDPTVLLIPNFYVDMEGGKPLPAYESSMLYDVLMERMTRARTTVLYVSSMDMMAKHYGSAMESLVTSHYLQFDGK